MSRHKHIVAELNCHSWLNALNDPRCSWSGLFKDQHLRKTGNMVPPKLGVLVMRQLRTIFPTALHNDENGYKNNRPLAECENVKMVLSAKLKRATQGTSSECLVVTGRMLQSNCLKETCFCLKTSCKYWAQMLTREIAERRSSWEGRMLRFQEL